MTQAQHTVGKGTMYFSTVDAMDLYGQDSAATKYVQNILSSLVLGSGDGCKTAADNQPIGFGGMQAPVVTGVFSDHMYVESADRSMGIKVEITNASVGDTVRVTGTLSTDSNGEREVVNAAVGPVGTGSVAPFFTGPKALLLRTAQLQPSHRRGSAGNDRRRRRQRRRPADAHAGQGCLLQLHGLCSWRPKWP